MENQVMTPEAQQTLQSVYLPAFLEKCAERGVELTSEDDVQDMLEIAAAVRMHKEGSRRSVIKEAGAALRRRTGLDKVREKEAQAAKVAEITQRFSRDEQIRGTVAKLVAQSTETQPEE